MKFHERFKRDATGEILCISCGEKNADYVDKYFIRESGWFYREKCMGCGRTFYQIERDEFVWPIDSESLKQVYREARAKAALMTTEQLKNWKKRIYKQAREELYPWQRRQLNAIKNELKERKHDASSAT